MANNDTGTPTYPGARNNDAEQNNEVFRDLSLINQPAGVLEFVNTKDDEMVTVAHKNGSLMRFNKLSTDCLNTNDKREVTMGDVLEEVQGNKTQIFHKDVETIQFGDSINKVGDVDKWQKHQEEMKKKLKNVHNIRRLFEIKRTKNHNSIDQAPEQSKSGSLADSPSAEIKTKTLITKTPTEYTVGVKEACAHEIPIIEGGEDEYKDITASDGWGEFTGWGTEKSPSSQDGSWEEETAKKEIAKKREEIQLELFENEQENGQNKHRDGGTQINKIAKDFIQVTGLAFNDMESFRRDPVGKLVPYGVKIDPFGNSVYTQYRESPLIEHVSVDKLIGGSHHIVANDEFNVTAGSNGMSLKTTGMMETFAPIIMTTAEQINMNSRGEIALAGKRVDISGEIITLRPKIVEREIEDSSGNAATLPANDKNKTEPEQQVLIDGNLNVEKNTIIAGGLHIEGEVSLHHITAPMEEQITDGCFEWGKQIQCGGAGKPVHCGGAEGTDVTILNGPPDSENEATCETEELPKAPVHADILEGCIIGVNACDYIGKCSDGADFYIPKHTLFIESVCAPNSIIVHDHMHYFKNLPLKLIRDNIELDVTVGSKKASKTVDAHSAVRAVGARNNFATRVLAKPVSNSSTQETVVEKFGGNACDPLVIDNGNWEESNANETLPSTEGVRSAKYTDEDINAIVAQLEAKFEAKYKELQDKLAQITQN